MGDVLNDPEELALLLVQQYLDERGFTQALSEVEKASGVKYYPARAPTGSMLLDLVYRHIEHNIADQPVDEEAARREREEEELLQGGHSDYPAVVTCSLDGLHSTNITSVVAWPGQARVITGAGDGTLQCIDMEGIIQWRTKLTGGGILNLMMHPHTSEGDVRLLVGSMDGSVCLLDAESGDVLAMERPHTKFCVRVRWAPDGTRALSAAWSHSFAVHECPGDGCGAAGLPRLTTISTQTYATAVQDAEWLDDGTLAIVAIKGSNLLRIFNTRTFQEEERINMNALGDNHVSFSATQLCRSPCKRYLLVSTDGPRILMFRIAGWEQARNFYGLPVEKFHQPATAWHRSSMYIFAGALGGHLYIYHVGSSKVAATVKLHEKNVRALDYDPIRNVLVTCSFDRTVKILESA